MPDERRLYTTLYAYATTKFEGKHDIGRFCNCRRCDSAVIVLTTIDRDSLCLQNVFCNGKNWNEAIE